MRIKREDVCALIIDFQEKLVPVMQSKERIVNNTEILIKGLKELKIPMIVTEQYPKGLGKTVDSIEKLVSDIVHLEKNHFSCILDSKIKEEVKKMGRKFVIVAGLETHICVLQTVVDLLEEGYIPVVIENCTTTRIIKDKKAALDRMFNEGAIISTTESILFEIMQCSEAAEFKVISSYVKELE